MNLYYSTCPAGLEKLLVKLAPHTIRGFSLKRTLPGAILYTAAALTPNCGGFHNTYAALGVGHFFAGQNIVCSRISNGVRHKAKLLF